MDSGSDGWSTGGCFLGTAVGISGIFLGSRIARAFGAEIEGFAAAGSSVWKEIVCGVASACWASSAICRSISGVITGRDGCSTVSGCNACDGFFGTVVGISGILLASRAECALERASDDFSVCRETVFGVASACWASSAICRSISGVITGRDGCSTVSGCNACDGFFGTVVGISGILLASRAECALERASDDFSVCRETVFGVASAC